MITGGGLAFLARLPRGRTFRPTPRRPCWQPCWRARRPMRRSQRSWWRSVRRAKPSRKCRAWSTRCGLPAFASTSPRRPSTWSARVGRPWGAPPHSTCRPSRPSLRRAPARTCASTAIAKRRRPAVRSTCSKPSEWPSIWGLMRWPSASRKSASGSHLPAPFTRPCGSPDPSGPSWASPPSSTFWGHFRTRGC